MMDWVKAELCAIDDAAFYVVKDNGGEWRDFDLSIQPGRMVARRLHPDFVRGRPEWICKIVQPVVAASAAK